MKRFLLATAALVGAAVAQDALATTATSSIAASATVSTVCAMTTTPLAFGEVALSGVTTGATPGTATVNVTCTGGGTYSVGLDSGLNNVAAQRNLKSGSNVLGYGLFTDLAHGTVWPVAPGVSGTGNIRSVLSARRAVYSATAACTFASKSNAAGRSASPRIGNRIDASRAHSLGVPREPHRERCSGLSIQLHCSAKLPGQNAYEL